MPKKPSKKRRADALIGDRGWILRSWFDLCGKFTSIMKG